MSTRSVTIKDIARVVGVAPSTVSKALNGSEEVSASTRARVASAAARLGNRPNAIARSLKVRRTHTLGVITNDREGAFTTAMVHGVAEVASEHNFGVFLCNSYGGVAKERRHIELLLDKQVDGIILTGYKVEQRGAPAAATGDVPLVYLYSYTFATDSPCILPDDEGGAELATKHLLSLGRRRPAFINGPPSYEATHLRLAGYEKALLAAGCYDPALVRVSLDWNQDSGFLLAQKLMAEPDPPDAILCANDDLAAGAILGLSQLNRQVPSDVAIVGFDDRPFAAHLPVPLTTVALPLFEMGVSAAHMLFGLLASGPRTNEQIRVPCRLVVRESCGAGMVADNPTQ
ncbi:MAG TPA: LacI family DNA-binding transcriptional regulator [Acidimicrobiales bacterium]|nr:LacI family DNA-binding transcriptional regulator [Acidimicrobiales bacterium]